MEQDTGAVRLMRTLHQRGVRMCFANPGTTEMWLVSAMDTLSKDMASGTPHVPSSESAPDRSSAPAGSGDTAASEAQPGIRAVLGLHENVCTGAADGYARMARAPAAVILHLGPGLSNGFANLHNARRARSPVLCLVGDMATWHVAADPLLHSDISGLARTVSRAVASPLPHTTLNKTPATGSTAAAATAATTTHSASTGSGSSGSNGEGGTDWASSMPECVWDVLGCNGHTGPSDSSTTSGAGINSAAKWHMETGVSDGRVVTLVVPHDLSWETNGPPGSTTGSSTATASTPGPAAHKTSAQAEGPLDLVSGQLTAAAQQFLRDCAAAVAAARKGSVALYIGGEALLAEGDALVNAGRIAAGCGASLLCENAFARLDRGSGLPCPRRLPYFPQEASQELARYELLVVVDTRLPVANFGYQDGPSALVPKSLLDKDAVWELDTAGQPGAAAALLAALAQELGVRPGQAKEVKPGVNCGALFPAAVRPAVPADGTKLSPSVLCTVVAALQPEGCVVVDEALTSGGSYWDLCKGCPHFSHLGLTGGAIGSGPPMALGAALASPPGTVVINLQADGSAMYSLQALWSQARERTHVITIICSNRSYAILKVECARQRLPAPGPVTRSLTDLSTPVISWVELARGLGVRASQAATAGELSQQLREAIAYSQGPSLIEAVL